MTALVARHRPGAAGRRAVRHVHRDAARPAGRRPRARAAPAGPRAFFPALGAYVGGDIVAGMLATGHGPRQADPAVHRRRHQLRDRAQRRRHGSSSPPRRPGRRSRAARSGAACAPPTAPSRWSSSASTATTSSSRSSATSSRRGLCGSGLVDAVAELVRVGLLDAAGRFVPDEDAASRARASPTGSPSRRGAGVRAPPARARTPTRRTAWTSPSATCASCSSPRPRSPPAGRCCSRSSASSPRRAAGAARRVVRLLPLPRLRRTHRPGAAAPGAAHRLRRQRRRRGREDGAADSARARRRRTPCWRRCAMSSSPTAPTSTTASSTSSPSPADPTSPLALIACGAIAQPAAEIVGAARLAGRRAPAAAAAAQPAAADRRRGRGAGRRALRRRRTTGSRSGTPTAAPTAPSTRSATRSGCQRLAGLHCYDVYAGADRLAAFFEEQPGTYVLTDFLVRSFARTVVPSWASTATPSCATPTSATTPGWCGWRRSPTTPAAQALAEHGRRRSGLPLTVVDDRRTRPRAGAALDSWAQRPRRARAEPRRAAPAATPRSRRPG